MPACEEFSGYEAMFFPEYIACFGLEHWDIAMEALAHMTCFSSAEFAVRPFIFKEQNRMMAQMLRWSQSDNAHVRRLASEGCRPRLPWAVSLPAFKRDPSPAFPILNQLQVDESLYVRKSVGNHLNDISKDHPEQVMAWCAERIGKHVHTDWIIRRGCRTLLKQGNPDVLLLMGYGDPSALSVNRCQLNADTLQIGDDLIADIHLQSEACQSVMPVKVRVDCVVDYVRRKGKRSQRVFHGYDGEMTGVSLAFRFKCALRQMSTRRHYPGEHGLEIRINGIKKHAVRFQLNQRS
jgi:3-methyladenine DNA glycosylase AlkC